MSAVSVDNVTQGSSCLATNISEDKVGNYIGEWQIANVGGCGQPLTKVCLHGKLKGDYNLANFELGLPCYIK